MSRSTTITFTISFSNIDSNSNSRSPSPSNNFSSRCTCNSNFHMVLTRHSHRLINPSMHDQVKARSLRVDPMELHKYSNLLSSFLNNRDSSNGLLLRHPHRLDLRHLHRIHP